MLPELLIGCTYVEAEYRVEYGSLCALVLRCMSDSVPCTIRIDMADALGSQNDAQREWVGNRELVFSEDSLYFPQARELLIRSRRIFFIIVETSNPLRQGKSSAHLLVDLLAHLGIAGSGEYGAVVWFGLQLHHH